jgi:hypothetical protein
MSDDLVPAAEVRGNGIRLFDAVAVIGREGGRARLVLDTALDKVLARRFYYRQGMLARALCFSRPLAPQYELVGRSWKSRPQATSRRLAGQIVDRIAVIQSDARVITRDLAAEPPPHPDRDLYDAILSPPLDDDPRFALLERYICELVPISYPVTRRSANNADIRITTAPVAMTSRPANKRRIHCLHYAKL